jgi:hypothetical protein
MNLPPDAPLEIEISLSKVDLRQLVVFWGGDMAERWGLPMTNDQ